ncbi:MAG: SEC-C domain-containing protein [Proteobacteria bacterium]|nr:SEC-C domain-containing protein [Pseudomonadota bacterium]
MGKKSRSAKLRRNDPCPCGSGKKVKKCHGVAAGRQEMMPINFALDKSIQNKIAEHKAIAVQRQKQQGLGRPIISENFKGHRFVAVGNELRWSEKWKTFHDFLFDYIKTCFGKEWWLGELAKAPQKRHPILIWAVLLSKYTAEHFNASDKIHSTLTTGAIDAYLGLSYNLYLLAHNVELQKSLVHRLKNMGQFLGAYYETFVAAAFIKAGFILELEDETDSSTSHCEFTATYKETGNKFSVEAKARKGGDPSPDIGDQLYRALKKRADHPRVVFIELNSPPRVNNNEVTDFVRQISDHLRELEERLFIKGNPAPAAYIFLTNFPYQFNLEATNVLKFAFVEGYKIPEFNFGLSTPNIREGLRIRKDHYEMYQLMKSIREHSEIPSTFDGEAPEMAFGKTEARLKIGQQYLVPDKDGKDVVGELVEATVAWDKVMGIYKLEDGRSVIATCPLTTDELAAYRKYPNTFFGVYKEQGKKAETPLELFDFFFDVYKQTSDTPPAERVASGSPPEGGVFIGKAPLELYIIYFKSSSLCC